MKKHNNLISFLLVIMLCLNFSVPALAAETEPPTNSAVEKHTIEIVTGSDSSSEDSGISPYVWNQNSYNVNNVCYTTTFRIPERYFAYEVTAYNEYSQPCNVNFVVQLTTANGSLISSVPTVANGGLVKVDWIQMNPNIDYRFKIINDTSTKLRVIITYYSWA